MKFVNCPASACCNVSDCQISRPGPKFPGTYAVLRQEKKRVYGRTNFEALLWIFHALVKGGEPMQSFLLLFGALEGLLHAP